MKCPMCDYENINGAETCLQCSADLSFAPPADRPIESRLVEDTILSLKPRAPISVRPEARVAEVIRLMADAGIGCALVAEGERLLGVFTERDVLRKVAHRAPAVADQPVSDLMTADPETLSFDASVGFAVNLMAVGGYRHVPITDGDKLCGIVSVRDIVDYMGKWYPDILAAQ